MCVAIRHNNKYTHTSHRVPPKKKHDVCHLFFKFFFTAAASFERPTHFKQQQQQQQHCFSAFVLSTVEHTYVGQPIVPRHLHYKDPTSTLPTHRKKELKQRRQRQQQQQHNMVNRGGVTIRFRGSAFLLAVWAVSMTLAFAYTIPSSTTTTTTTRPRFADWESRHSHNSMQSQHKLIVQLSMTESTEEPPSVNVQETSSSSSSSSSSPFARIKQKIWEKTTTKANRLVDKVSNIKAKVSGKMIRTNQPSDENMKQINASNAAPTSDAIAGTTTASPLPSDAEASSASSNGMTIVPTKKRNKVQAVLSPRMEKKLARKYAQIDCLEEKAFTILQDLGMVETTLDFSI